jgi:xyloglucan-specific exo-beta-1,4-glucanase
VDLGIGGSMCHTERYFVKKAIYVNLPGSLRITYRFCDVSYRATVWEQGKGRMNRATGQYIDGLGTSQDGADLSQWQTSGSSNQQWSVITVGSSGARQSALLPDSNNPGDLDIKFYPNPFVSNFKLEVPDSGEPFEVVFFDMNGRAVEASRHAGGSNALTLGVGLKPGLYMVKVKGVSWSRTFRVFKK